MRTIQLSLNKSWRFFRGEVTGNVEDKNFDDSKWEVVSVPHTARVEPAMCSGGINYQGTCWYRKRFFLDEKSKNKKVWIKFEGAKHIAEVWLNGEKLGIHLGGYLPFTFDVSDVALKVGENVLVVKLDNTDQPDIPPGKPQDTLDFCYFGGLYRNVWLYETEKLYITDAVYANEVASGGVFVTTEHADKNEAEIKIQTHLKNEAEEDKKIALVQVIYDKEGRPVATSTKEIVLGKGDAKAYSQTLKVESPELWHPDTPTLYKVETLLKEEGKIYDKQITMLGIRRIAFDQEGFKINGKSLKLIGTNKSQEYIFIGDALSDTLHEREVIKLKEAGFNCIRTGHYPFGRAFMEACDRVGMLCIVPIPGWQWFKDENLFKNRSYQTLRDMIREHRNHPSIMIWEPILNETRYTEEYARTTYAITHEEYPGDQCYAGSDAYLAAAEIYDVPYGNEKNTLRSDRCCFVREYGDNYREQFGPQKTVKRCSRGESGFYPGGAEAMLKSALERMVQTDRLWLHRQIAGGAIWTGIDCNRGYIGNVAAAGVLDLYRLPKFSAYAYKSQKEQDPMVFAATYWQKPIKPFVVFSNCEEVKVYVNEALVATQKANRDYLESPEALSDASHFATGIVNCIAKDMVDGISTGLKHPPFVFDEDFFQEGILRVEGLIEGKVVATQTLITPKEAKKIKLVVDDCTKNLVADGVDMVMIHAYIQDEQGMLVPDAYNKITFSVEGPAKIVGDHIDRVAANPVKAEAGAIGVLIKADYEAGEIMITAYAEGLEDGKISFISEQDTRAYVEGTIEIAPVGPITYQVDTHKVSRKISFNEFDWAMGKKIIASSYEEGHLPSAVVDNQQDTSWKSKTSDMQWLIIDLEEAIDLTGCKIWWESDNTDYHYEIYVSEDRETWKQVIKKIGTGQDIKPDTFNASQTRYMKIVISKVSKGVPEICSLQIFGIKNA